MNAVDGLSWRKIAQRDEYRGIVSAGTLCSFAKEGSEYEPKKHAIRLALGLPTVEKIEQFRGPRGTFEKRDKK